MAQLVFIHGVATRPGDTYDVAVANRDKLFTELLFAGTDVHIASPLWGNLVHDIGADVYGTDGGVKTFSLNVAPMGGLGSGLTGGATGPTIVDVARQDPVVALDAICSQLADRAASEGRFLDERELQAFRMAAQLIAQDGAGHLLDGDANGQADGDAIARQLSSGIAKSYGLGSVVGDAIAAVTDRLRNAASTLGFNAVRDAVRPAIAQFIGDVFVYLKEGEQRRQIQAVVAQALRAAHEGRQAGKGPIVVVGHSLGGVILIDMLSNPDAAGVVAGLEIDALLTVGSQPGLFAALDVIAPHAGPGGKRQKPAQIRHWLNVFDPIDPFAFRADMVFDGVEDLVFNSMAGISETHSKYFQRPQFYSRARTRLQHFGVL